MNAAMATFEGREGIEETLTELRAQNMGTGKFMEDLLDQLDELQNEVVVRARQLESHRRQLAERERQLRQQRRETEQITRAFDQQNSQLTHMLAELDQIKAEVAAERGEVWDENTETLVAGLREERDELRRDRDRLQRELDIAQEEVEQLQSEAQRVPVLEEELAVARQKNSDLERQLASDERSHEPPADGQSNVHIDSLQQECNELESELELVRQRATELDDTVREQRQQNMQREAEWSSEMNQLRQIIERQSAMLDQSGPGTAQPVAAASATTATVPTAAVPIATAGSSSEKGDMVVDSVMAQFARLQEDVSRRRARGQR